MKSLDLILARRYGTAEDDYQLLVVITAPSTGGNDADHLLAADAVSGQRATLLTTAVVATIPSA